MLTKKNTKNINNKTKKIVIKQKEKLKVIIEPIKNKIHDNLFFVSK